MTRQQRLRRAHALAYKMLQQAIDSGFVDTEHVRDETDADRAAIHKLLDKMAQSHFNRSDL